MTGCHNPDYKPVSPLIEQLQKLEKRLVELEEYKRKVVKTKHPDFLYEKIKMLEREIDRLGSNERKMWQVCENLDQRLDLLEEAVGIK